MRRTDPEEQPRTYFRTPERLFALNGQWFYCTREGDVGPFRSREAAEKDVARYAREQRDLERYQVISALRRMPRAIVVPRGRVTSPPDHGISREDLMRRFRQ